MKIEKKELIIKAAIEVLMRNNYESMKTDAVAKKAGIGHGTIYLYFKNKESLFVEVLKYINLKLALLFFDNIKKENSFLQNLTILSQNFLLKKKQSDNYYKIIYKAYSEIDHLKIKNVLNDNFQTIFIKLKEIIAWAMEKKEIAANEHLTEIWPLLIYGLGDILWQRDLISPQHKVTEESINMIKNFLLGSLQLKK